MRFAACLLALALDSPEAQGRDSRARRAAPPSPSQVQAWTPSPTATIAQAGSLEGQLLPDSRDPTLGGLASLLLRIREARATARGAFLLVGSGDLTGAASPPDLEQALRVIDELEAEGLVASVLGEREIALGLAGLEALARHARAPLVSANLARDDGRLVAESHVVVDAGPRRLAIIGLSRHPADCPLPEGLRLLPAREALRQVLPAALATADAVVIVGQFAAFETSAWSRDLPEGAVFMTTTKQGEVSAPRPQDASWTLRAASPRSLAVVALHVASDGTVILVDSEAVPLSVRDGDAEAIDAMARRWSVGDAAP